MTSSVVTMDPTTWKCEIFLSHLEHRRNQIMKTLQPQQQDTRFMERWLPRPRRDVLGSFLFFPSRPQIPFVPFLTPLLCHRQLLQLEGRCASGLSWALSWPRLSLDPRVCPITSAAAAPYITSYSWSFPLPLINPLLTESEMIKGRSIKAFYGGNRSLISHMFDACAPLASETSLLITNSDVTKEHDEMLKYTSWLRIAKMMLLMDYGASCHETAQSLRDVWRPRIYFGSSLLPPYFFTGHVAVIIMSLTCSGEFFLPRSNERSLL